jgi:hypothetical protein
MMAGGRYLVQMQKRGEQGWTTIAQRYDREGALVVARRERATLVPNEATAVRVVKR